MAIIAEQQFTQKIHTMKKSNVLLFTFLMLVTGLTAQSNFTLTSKDLGGQATTLQEFNGFGCTGDNISPVLSWKNPPSETKSFAVTMYDPDAPTGSGWWHWVMFDIPMETEGLVANAGNVKLNLAPKGAIQSLTDYGVPGYGGPCPPEGHGFHQYVITVHALKTDHLGLDEKANAAVVGYYLGQNTLAKASIVAYYKREK